MRNNLVAFGYLFDILSITQHLRHQLISIVVSYFPKNSAEFSEEELLVLEQNVYSYYAQFGNAPPPDRRPPQPPDPPDTPPDPPSPPSLGYSRDNAVDSR